MKRAARPVFRGFHPEAFRFFRLLARNNHKPWFDRHRAIYEEHVAGALKGLFEELAPVVAALHPDFEVSGRTGKNFSRINRDIRFARDKSPYRRNLYLYFGHRSDPQLGTRLYVGLSAEGVTCGFATYDGRESALDRLLKPRLARSSGRAGGRDPFEQVVRRLARRYEIYWHGVERGEWKKHPGSPRTEKDWKRCKAWVVRRVFPAGHRELRAPGFARTVAGIYRELFPLYAFSAVAGRAGESALRTRKR